MTTETSNAREWVELIEAAKNASAVLGHIYHTTPLPPALENEAHDAYQRFDSALRRVSFEWFNAKNDCWTPIDRLPHMWELELGILWRVVATGEALNGH